jgi:membrane protease YdiL (CAAX protease family)
MWGITHGGNDSLHAEIKANQQDSAVPSAGDGYLNESRRPLASLLFVLPVLALYELGVVLLGPQAIRNGADVWIEGLLDHVGLRQALALPALVVVILLAWHHLLNEPWRVRGSVLYGMWVESAALGVILFLAAHVQSRMFDVFSAPVALAAGEQPGPVGQLLAKFVSYCGAGVYEEVLFRLTLMPLLAIVLHGLGVSWVKSWIAAAVLGSLAFAAAHHIGTHGEAIDLAASGFWFAFSFRFVAGLFFSLLFVYRGFGIAVGTHAIYDMLAGFAT